MNIGRALRIFNLVSEAVGDDAWKAWLLIWDVVAIINEEPK